MSRGYGKVQWGCLTAIAEAEHARKPPPTTYDIVARVYHAKVDDDRYWITDAQHVAVKRALEGLQRQGKVIGFEKLYCRNDGSYDGRSERSYCWMSERRAQQRIREQRKERAVLVGTFEARMREFGMKPK
jgi:hypothetical protein